jgi:tetratricopeptide (TPR) repeat protein
MPTAAASALSSGWQLPGDLDRFGLFLSPDGSMNSPIELMQKALGLQQMGRSDEAAAILRGLLSTYPDQPQLLYLLGGLELKRGKLEEGVSLLRKSVKYAPGEAGFWCDLAIGLQKLGRSAEALDSIERALKLQPQNPAFHYNRANVLLGMEKAAEALAGFDRALALEPRAAQAHDKRGVALIGLGRANDALAAFDRALALDGNQATAHYGRGDALGLLGRWEESLASFDRALVLAPSYADAAVGRGTALLAFNRPAEALAFFDRAIASDPDIALAHHGRGNALRMLDRLDAAAAAYERAIACDVDCIGAHVDKAHLLMQQNRHAEAWEEYEWRLQWPVFKEQARGYGKPYWKRGTDIAGKTVLLWAEQGLGDAIQFSRFIRQVEAKGARTIVEVQPQLAGLMRSLDIAGDVIAAGEPRPPFDVHCSLLSLPYLTGAGADAEVPYLHADPQKVAFWRDELGAKTRPRIGLTWSGRATYRAEHNRRIPLALLGPLLNLPFEFYVLQKDIRDDDRPILACCPQLVLHEKAVADFAETAALASVLDLVIAQDSAIAHLAGAMGLPLWVLLGRFADLRWNAPNGRNRWYPAAQFFRRSPEGSWEEVIADVIARLKTEFGV